MRVADLCPKSCGSVSRVGGRLVRHLSGRGAVALILDDGLNQLHDALLAGRDRLEFAAHLGEAVGHFLT